MLESQRSDLQRRSLTLLGAILFLVGVITGITLFGGATWADLEAEFYGFERLNGAPLSTVDCPILITEQETDTVTASFTNQVDRTFERLIRADFSSPVELRSERTRIQIDPGETEQIEWNVSAQDKDLGFFIFMKIYAYPAYQQPFQDTNCGIMVVDVPFLTGDQVLTLTFSVSLLGMVGGLVLWERSHQPLTGRSSFLASAMRIFAAIVLLGILASLSGWWLAGMFLLAVSVLMVTALMFFLLYQ